MYRVLPCSLIAHCETYFTRRGRLCTRWYTMLLARTTAAPQDRGPRPRTPRESSASTEHRQAYERAAIVVVPHRSPRRTGSAGNPRRVLPGHFDARWPWLDTAGAAQHQQTTRYGYGEQHGLEDSPLRVLTLPADPAPAPRGTQETMAAQGVCGFDELGFATLHEDGRDSVWECRCVNKCPA